MSLRLVKSIGSIDGERRLLIHQRTDGFFAACEEMVIRGNDGQRYWTTADPSHFRPFICDTARAAEREALGRVDWQPLSEPT